MASTAGKYCLLPLSVNSPLPTAILSESTLRQTGLLHHLSLSLSVVLTASQKRFRASQLGGRVKDQQRQRAASPPSRTMSTKSPRTIHTISNSPRNGSPNNNNTNTTNNNIRTVNSDRSPRHHGQRLPNMSSPPGRLRPSSPATSR